MIPYAVGVDIACRMKMTVLDIPVRDLEQKQDRLTRAIEAETRFGVGASLKHRREHEVMDADWSVIGVNLAHRSFRVNRKEVIEPAFAVGVRTMIITGTSLTGSQEVLRIAHEYLDVVDAQRTAVQSERQEVQLHGQRAISTILLAKALGGGWNN